MGKSNEFDWGVQVNWVRVSRVLLHHSIKQCLKVHWKTQNGSFAKFAIAFEFAALRIPALSLTVSNLSLHDEMLSNRQFRQIRHFCRIRRFPDIPSFACCLKSKTWWRNVVKLSLSPNSPLLSNSPLFGYPLFCSLSQILDLMAKCQIVTFATYSPFSSNSPLSGLPHCFARFSNLSLCGDMSSSVSLAKFAIFVGFAAFRVPPSFVRCLKSKN